MGVECPKGVEISRELDHSISVLDKYETCSLSLSLPDLKIKQNNSSAKVTLGHTFKTPVSEIHTLGV